MTILRTDIVSGIDGRNAIDGSVYFDSTNDRLSVPNSADVRVGSDDFTIEAWIKLGNPGDWTTVLGMWDSSATRRTYALQRKKSDSKLYFYVSADGGSTISATATQYAYGGNVTLGDWHHVAGVRDGNTIRAYLNGVEVGNASFTASILNNTTDALFIGDTEVTAGGEAFHGYMSNVRFIKGTCLYPSGTPFTPPTEKLKAIDGTVLLCCQDSDNVLQEATGKTITAYGNLDYSLITDNLITNGNFDSSATDGWTVASGSAALGTGQSGTFGDGNHLVLTSGTMTQAFTTVIGRTYFVNAQSNGADNSFISTTTSSGDAIITDIRSSPQTGKGVHGQKSFIATQTTYYVILTGGGGGGNFDNISVYQRESLKAPKVFPSVGKDDGTVFEGDITFDSLNYMTLPKGTTIQSNRGRGLFMGGYTPTPSATNLNSIDYIQIQSLGNSINFGDLTQGRYGGGGGASSIRAIKMGGRVSSTRVQTIDYVTIATTGNAIVFGDLQNVNAYVQGASNNTRALNMGGATPAYTNLIEYVTIASTGDGTDFGVLTDARGAAPVVASPTRACCVSGYDGSSYVTVIDQVQIATTANATEFGDVSSGFGYGAGLSSNTRGIVGGGTRGSGEIDDIVYITIATTGNATDFGNLTYAREHTSATSNSVRGVFGGGVTPTYYNNIQYITIATTGDSLDFGDMIVDSSKAYSVGTSDSHGGLS